jgi:hypothetical protein
MNGEHAPTAMTESREQHSYARLHGRWIMLARGIWITLVVLTLAIFFASLPVYIALRQTLCAGTECASGTLLTPAQAEVLTGIGLSLSDYAAYSVAFTLATIVVCLVVSTLIIWRRPDDRMALLVALMLVSFGPLGTMTTILAGAGRMPGLPRSCFIRARLSLVSSWTVRAQLHALDCCRVSRSARPRLLAKHAFHAESYRSVCGLSPGSRRGGDTCARPTLPLSA